jgi:flavin reductase (DIM6/NTAB) family NADH-FMN oxidoreductase RutF
MTAAAQEFGKIDGGKVDVKPEWWDNIFAPSSCLVLITTVDRDGHVNAAAYGTCTRICHDPVYIAFTCGTGKDTYHNVLATGEFTVNVVPFEQAMLDRVLVCGLPFKGGVNELDKAGLTALPARKLRPPRIAECRSHFECKVAWTRQWVNRLMVCGKVEAVSIDAGCMTEAGFIVWDKVKPARRGISRGGRLAQCLQERGLMCLERISITLNRNALQLLQLVAFSVENRGPLFRKMLLRKR